MLNDLVMFSIGIWCIETDHTNFKFSDESCKILQKIVKCNQNVNSEKQ